MTQAKHKVGDIVIITHNTTDHGFLIGDWVRITKVFINEATGYVSYGAVLAERPGSYTTVLGPQPIDDWFIDDDDLSE